MHTTYTRFEAYGSETYLPLLGELKVTMRNVRGKEIATTVYVIESQGESLLGKEDTRALGILSTDPERAKRTERTAAEKIRPGPVTPNPHPQPNRSSGEDGIPEHRPQVAR